MHDSSAVKKRTVVLRGSIYQLYYNGIAHEATQTNLKTSISLDYWPHMRGSRVRGSSR